RDVPVPFIFMTYSNSILASGVDRFFARAQSAGVDGVIIPDLTPEEGKPFEQAPRKHRLHVIYLVTPNTAAARIEQSARAAQGFLYAVSLAGVTRGRQRTAAGGPGFLAQPPGATPTPLA